MLRRLSDAYGGGLRGVRVIECHKEHGVHYHALVNQRIPVWLVRRWAKRCGIGRVQVKKANSGSIDYLAKYLSKQWQQENGSFKGQTRWGTIGGFRGVKVRDVEVCSRYMDRLEIAKDVLNVRKVPFLLAAQLKERWTASDDQVEEACKRYLVQGSINCLWTEKRDDTRSTGWQLVRKGSGPVIARIVCDKCRGWKWRWDDGVEWCEGCNSFSRVRKSYGKEW